MIDVVNKIVDESIKLNNVPAELIKKIAKEDDLTLKVYVLNENGSTEDIVFLLGFENNKYTVGLALTYDWLYALKQQAAQAKGQARIAREDADRLKQQLDELKK